MNKSFCREGCKNIPALDAYADMVTAREAEARRQYGAGCQVGTIACSGALENPVFGKFCQAQLSPPVVNEHPEASWVSPARTIGEIPGFDIFAASKIAIDLTVREGAQAAS